MSVRIEDRPAGRALLTGRGSVARWVGIYAAAEGITVAVSILIGASTAPRVLLAALVEGMLLGTALGVLALGLRGRDALMWTVATVAGMMLGRLLEYLAATSALAAALGTSPLLAQAAAGSALGCIAGVTFAALQSWLLRRSVRHSGYWMLISGAVWCLMFPLILFVGVVTEGFADAPMLAQAAIDVVLFSGVGALVGAANGYGFRAMLEHTPAPLSTDEAEVSTLEPVARRSRSASLLHQLLPMRSPLFNNHHRR